MRSPSTPSKTRTLTPGRTTTSLSGRRGSRTRAITPAWQPTSWPRGEACQPQWWFMVRPAQSPGMDREDGKQRSRGMCLSLQLSLFRAERTVGVIHNCALACLSHLVGREHIPIATDVLFFLPVPDYCERVTFPIPLLKIMLQVVHFLPLCLCLCLKRSKVGNFCLPTRPKYNIHSHPPQTRCGHFLSWHRKSTRNKHCYLLNSSGIV